MKKTFFARYAIVILVVVCFFTPFVLRGAREALRGMKNDVKDWLPKHFKETGDIEWFWRHFHGERFIILSWPGCVGDEQDEAFHLFKKKLAPAIPPSKQGQAFPRHSSKDLGSTWLERPYSFIGDQLGLYALTNDHLNWGGLQEKWLRGSENRWYYITPSGELFAFEGQDSPVASLGRDILRRCGWYTLTGKPLASFGPKDGPWFYADPSRLNAQLFRSVMTGPDVLADMTRQSESGVQMVSDKEALDKLSGVLYGPDGKQTAMIITATEVGRSDFHRLLSRGILGKERGLIYKLAEECGIKGDDLRLGGPPVDNVSIDEEGSITLVRLVSLCALLGFTLSYLSFRSVMATLILFCTGGLSAALGLAIVGWTPNVTTDAVMMSMPALVYVLGISGAVHIINYYREACDETGVVAAPEKALSHAWKPAILCNVTTAFGLLSLCSSEVEPIRKFGIFSAAGVMATLLLLFTYVPAALETWPLNLPKQTKREDGAESWLDAYLSGFWERFGGGIIRHWFAVGTACFLIIGVVGYGVTRINTSVNLLELYDGDARILRDYAWLEQHLGKLVPMEIVVKFSPDAIRRETADEGEMLANAEITDQRQRLSVLERLEALNKIESFIQKYLGDGPGGPDIVGQPMSVLTFMPKLPAPGESYAKRQIVNERLTRELDTMLNTDSAEVDKDDGSELWRVSLRVAAFRGIDLGDFVKELKEVVEPVLAAYNARGDIIQAAQARQAKLAAQGESPGAIRIGYVLPDAMASELFPKPPPKKRAGAKPAEGDAKTGPASESTASANTPAKLEVDANNDQYVRVHIDRDYIFARTLAESLRSARIGVQPILESKLKKEDLADLDGVVLLGQLQPATQDLVRASSLARFEASQILADALAAAEETDSSKVTRSAAQRSTSAVYTGVVPIVYKAQRTLLISLIDSTKWSILTITPLMILVSRNLWAGLVAMLPNALPVLVIFGAMGWADIRVDIGSMMTASIALGVAVDDTIHYLTWFREELDRVGDRRLAILGAYRRCATPTFQAATISGLGLSIFAFSTFTPTQRFGYLMLAILFAGVVAELVFFPALLASPLGRVFKPRGKSRDADGGDAGSRPTVHIDSARDASKKIAVL